jgi:RNA polymerase sigma-70 factor (ECF subfamily)
MDLIETRQSLLGRLKDWDDDKSWREFFDTYWRIIYSSARKAGLNDAEAQEVVQETVLSVAKKMKEFKYDPATGSFKGWLKQLTRRRIADQYRKHPKREVQMAADSGSASAVSPIEKLPDPALAADVIDAAWENDWRQNLLDRAVEIVKNEVSPRQFQIFDLHVLRHQSVAEVATALGISRAQVHLAKHRVSALISKTVRRLEKTLF